MAQTQNRRAGVTRRFVARGIDWLIAGTVSAAICWPIAFHVLSGMVTDTAQAASLDFVRGRAINTAGTLDTSMQSIQTVLALTLVAQVALVFVYEWLLLTLTSTTLGKALVGVRVRVEGDIVVRRHWTVDRALRFAKRTTLTVLPGGFITVAIPLGLAGTTVAWLVAVALLLILIVDLAPGIGGRPAHDRLSGTETVRIAWAKGGEHVQVAAGAARDITVARSQVVRDVATQTRDSEAAKRAIAAGGVAVRRGQNAVGRVRESRIAGEATQQGRQAMSSAIKRAAQLRSNVQSADSAPPIGAHPGSTSSRAPAPPTAVPPAPPIGGETGPVASQ